MNLRYLASGWMAFMVTGVLYGQAQQQQVDPPARVARLNYINTNLSFRPGSQEDWAAATLNYPITTGDHLWSDQQGGAEMHVGPNALRIAGGTSFAVLNLDDHAMQVSVSQGFINIRIRRMDEGETFEVDTPNGAISLLGTGDYRVDVNGDANLTTVTVREGGAEMNGAGQTFPVNAGQQVRFSGADQLNAEASQVGPPDQWDQWCLSRDQKDEAAEQRVAPYVGNNMSGAEDLANYGDWRNDPSYGSYWVPRVAAGWEPYHVGHWAYVEPWGWTWVDDAPWGFAPFHYGRWAVVGGTWGWFPGAVVARPVYAPALVAFVGGSGFSAAVGVGGVGVAAWIPLGPREVYRPYYRTSDVYVRNVNITHINVTNVNVTNVNYVNRTHVTAVRQDVFVGAHHVSSGYVHVPPGAYGRMENVNAGSFRPAREAYMGRRMEGMRAVTPPRAIEARPVVVNRAPAMMAGRPAVAAYRPAPPVMRRMEVGPQGRYQPAANNGNPSRMGAPGNYGNRGNVGSPSPNYGSRSNTGSQTNYGNRNNTATPPNYGTRTNAGSQPGYRNPTNPGVQPNYGTPASNNGNRGLPGAQQQPNNRTSVPNYGSRNTGMAPNYGNRGNNVPVQQHSNVQQTPNMQQRPNVQQQRSTVQQQPQRPMVQQQQRPMVQQPRPNVQQQRPAVQAPPPQQQTKHR